MKEGYYDKTFNILLLGVDIFIIFFSFLLGFYLRFDFFDSVPVEFWFFLLLSIVLWTIITLYNKIYKLSKLRSLRKAIPGLIKIITLHLLLISLSFVSLNVQEDYIFPRLFLFYFYLILFLITFLIRIIYYLVIKGYYKHEFNDKNIKKVIILGTGGKASALYKGFIDTISHGSSFRVLGFFDDQNNGDLPDNLILGKIKELKSFCLKEKVNEIYYTESLSDVDRIRDLTKFADENFIYLRFVPDFSGLQKSKVDIFFLNSVPIIEYTQAPLGGFLNQRIKRIFDVVFSLGVIVFIYPFFFPIIAFLIKLESRGPVLFKQDRPGKGNELFKCYKFRTMRQNNNTEQQATKNDPRITMIGKFLRKTSLDEFPQFINVLQGKMSVVGPRPNLISQLEFYSKEIEKYRFRHFITPGITGWAQVNGYRGETKEIHLMKKRVELDAWYIENWSLSLDIKIIFLTIFKLAVGDSRAY
jgi:putative colanic acid biosynthesis UDP-glucose lipid carrier transferase